MLKMPWLKLYRVKGSSMEPTFKQGALLLGSALIKPKPGHVVVINRKPVSLKRIKRIDPAKGSWVEGDNEQASTDSRSYGYVTNKDIKAVIFMRLS